MTVLPSKAESAEVHIGESVYKIARSRLGTYIDLANVLEVLIEAVPIGDNSAITDCLFEYLNLAIPNLDRGSFESAPWYEIIFAYSIIQEINAIPQADQYAILNVPSGSKVDEVPWHYPGRNYIVWKHMIAKAYGWTLDFIDALWPEDAVKFLMEITADDMEEMEFLHQLSEISYEYDKATKKSHYRPLRRPMWMLSGNERTQSEKKKRILTTLRQDALPIGNVVRAENGNSEE